MASRCWSPVSQQPLSATQLFPRSGAEITLGEPPEMLNGAAR